MGATIIASPMAVVRLKNLVPRERLLQIFQGVERLPRGARHSLAQRLPCSNTLCPPDFVLRVGIYCRIEARGRLTVILRVMPRLPSTGSPVRRGLSQSSACVASWDASATSHRQLVSKYHVRSLLVLLAGCGLGPPGWLAHTHKEHTPATANRAITAEANAVGGSTTAGTGGRDPERCQQRELAAQSIVAGHVCTASSRFWPIWMSGMFAKRAANIIDVMTHASGNPGALLRPQGSQGPSPWQRNGATICSMYERWRRRWRLIAGTRTCKASEVSSTDHRSAKVPQRLIYLRLGCGPIPFLQNARRSWQETRKVL